MKTEEELIWESYTDNHLHELDDALSEISTLDLEDYQVSIPQYDEDKDSYVDQFPYQAFDPINIYIRNRDKIDDYGSHELFIMNNSDELIGFMRLTKSKDIISPNLVYFNEENRGYGYGKLLYKYFLENGYKIEADDEITESTKQLYLSLVKDGYRYTLDGGIFLYK